MIFLAFEKNGSPTTNHQVYSIAMECINRRNDEQELLSGSKYMQILTNTDNYWQILTNIDEY